MSRRNLSILEIDAIIAQLTFLETSNVANKLLMIEGYKTEVRKTLETIKVVPRTEAIIKIGKSFIDAYVDSQISTGVMVGSLASEALTRDLTQDSLNGKKNTGKSKNKITELDVFKTIVSFTSTDKSKLVTTKLYFKTLPDGSNPNFNYLLDQETNIKELTLEDIVIGIDGPDIPSIYFNSNSKDWYSNYEELYPNFNIHDTEWFVRLKIDTRMLFRYKLTLGEVCSRLRRSHNNLFECVHSPIFFNNIISYGYIDIYPIDSRIVKATKVRGKVKTKTAGMNASRLLNKIYLTNILIDELNIYVVSGINHISSYSVNKNNITNALGVSTIDPSTVNDKIKKWKLWINYGWLNYNYLDENFILKALDYLNLQSEFKGDHILVLSNKNPVTYIKDVYNNMETSFDNYVIDKTKQEKKDIKYRAKLQPPKYSGVQNSILNSFFVTLGGTNLSHLFMIPEVDTTRTLSQDLHETYHFFGISVTRNLMIARLIGIFKKVGIWVDPRHIMLLVDFMCFPGYPVKIGYHGATARDSDIMVRATMKLSAQTISSASLYGDEASVDTAVGMSMTGYVSHLGQEMKVEVKEEIIPVETADIDLESIMDLVSNLGDLELDEELSIEDDPDSIIMDPIKINIQNKSTAIVNIVPAPPISYDRTVLGEQLFLKKPTFSFDNCPIDTTDPNKIGAKKTQFPVATLDSNDFTIFSSTIDIDDSY